MTRRLVGTLRGFDVYVKMVLEDVTEYWFLINSTLNIDILLGPMNGSDMACDTESQGKWTK
ncbi:hypothetical protein NC652_023291 [Populus alba x Populus x berolinensis]|nr:hypothetical protein NC652_023291 [Populus alba x Populus x berolinensis]